MDICIFKHISVFRLEIVHDQGGFMLYVWDFISNKLRPVFWFNIINFGSQLCHKCKKSAFIDQLKRCNFSIKRTKFLFQ